LSENGDRDNPTVALTNENPASIVPTDQIRIAATVRIYKNPNLNCTGCQQKSELHSF